MKHGGSNSIGGDVKVVIPSEEMRLFDLLPSVVRQAAANSPIDYAVEDIYKSWQTASREDGLSAWEFANWLQRMFRQQTMQLSATGAENGSYILRKRAVRGTPSRAGIRARY